MLRSWKEHYWYGIPCVRARIEEIVRRSKGAYKVLEAGCNEGFLSMALLEAGFHVTSIDSDPEMIRRCKEKFGINALQEDITDLPFMDNEFDLAIGGEVLEHLSNPGKGLSELFRVSKGRVIITLPIGEYWLGEKTHQFKIDTTVIEHDQGIKNALEKNILVMEFNKRDQIR